MVPLVVVSRLYTRLGVQRPWKPVQLSGPTMADWGADAITPEPGSELRTQAQKRPGYVLPLQKQRTSETHRIEAASVVGGDVQVKPEGTKHQRDDDHLHRSS